MSDETDDTPDTYTPRRTHHLSLEQEAPHGGTRTLRYELKEGFTYTVVEGEEADNELGRAPVSNVRQVVRKSALP